MDHMNRKISFHTMKHLGMFLAVLVFTIVLTGFFVEKSPWSGARDAYGTTAYTGYIAGIQRQETAYAMLQKVNTARSNASVGSLKWDATLESAAMARAKEIAVYFAHTRPTGALWYTVSGKVNGENIFVGYLVTAKAANDAWMDSDTHRANRLNSGYKSYGAAAFQSRDGFVYWVELFGSTSSTNTACVGVNVDKAQTSVKVSDGYLNLKSTITTLDRKNVGDTQLRVGQEFYLTIRNWNKQFTYSDTQFSTGVFSVGNSAIASIDTKTGKIRCGRAGVTKVTGKVSSLSTVSLSRTIVVRPQILSGLVLTPRSKAVSMSWNPIAGVNGYEVYRAATATGAFTRVATVPVGTTTYKNTGLVSGHTYYFKVRGYVTKATDPTRYPGHCCKPQAAKVL